MEEYNMKNTKRLISCIMAVILAVTCSGVVSLFSAFADNVTITAVRIVTLPNKTVFVQGEDWDYGYYDMPEGTGKLGTFVSDKNYISFMHNGGYFSRYADRGMIDMTGLVVEVTYSNGSKENIAYKETISGTKVNQNILASPSADYKLGENTIEVYFKSNIYAYDSYKITLKEKGAATIKGDVNGDGSVNSMDALLVLQHVVGSVILTTEQFKIGDMDSNNKLNSMDALQILRKSVGQE